MGRWMDEILHRLLQSTLLTLATRNPFYMGMCCMPDAARLWSFGEDFPVSILRRRCGDLTRPDASFKSSANFHPPMAFGV